MIKFSSPATKGGSGIARNFKGGSIISTFFPVLFFDRTNLKLIKKLEKL